jgi:hypothetical protein
VSGETLRRRAATAVVLALLLGAAGTASAPASHPDPRVRDLDLVASANPSQGDPVVADDAFADNSSSFRRTVSSVVTATGSATCDGCDATGTALQVLYVRSSRQADLDNTAVAWAQGCTDCIATALSVQVVVLRGVPSVVPNNRALAVNAACASCQASGVAFQLVVSSRQAGRLSRDALDELRTWVAEQAALLRVPDPAATPPEPSPTTTARLARSKADRRAKRAATSALGTLEELVTDDLGAETVSADVELDR